MVQSRWRAVVLAALASVVASCDVGDDCSKIDCDDGVWVVAKPESGVWEPGEYELQLKHDGETERCGFSLPAHLPTPAATTFVDCGPRLRASLFALSDCSDNCTLSNSFELDLMLNSAPASFDIQLTRDGEVVATDSREVEYENVYPRGEECGGGCQQSRLSMVVDP